MIAQENRCLGYINISMSDFLSVESLPVWMGHRTRREFSAGARVGGLGDRLVSWTS